MAVDAGLGGREQPLHLAELRVGLLQLGGFAREHVEAIVVADRHLVGEAAEVPRKLGDVLGELEAAAAQLGHRAVRSHRQTAGWEHAVAATRPPARRCGRCARVGRRGRALILTFDRLGRELVEFLLVRLAGCFSSLVTSSCSPLWPVPLWRVSLLRPFLRPSLRLFLFFFALGRASDLPACSPTAWSWSAWCSRPRPSAPASLRL